MLTLVSGLYSDCVDSEELMWQQSGSKTKECRFRLYGGGTSRHLHTCIKQQQQQQPGCHASSFEPAEALEEKVLPL
jgi:hypothetical protein